jgi:hypothetical protein
MRRLILVLSLLCTTLVAGARPAQAGYDWCSVDPIFTFTRNGLLSSRVVDVQVLVPLSALPLKGTATLKARVPANVKGQVVLNTSVPLLFPLKTSIVQTKLVATTSPYKVHLDLFVPAGTKPFPVRILSTNLSTGKIKISEGIAGQTLRQTIAIVD